VCLRLFQVRRGRFSQFQNGDCDVLICTDIASRGLDTVRVCFIDDHYDSVYYRVLRFYVTVRAFICLGKPLCVYISGVQNGFLSLSVFICKIRGFGLVQNWKIVCLQVFLKECWFFHMVYDTSS